MAEADDLVTSSAEHSSQTGSGRDEVADFECNICFDLAQDPVITLCGHLHCWPCLYKWLRVHSRSHECPVCKALIEEEKLIPLYGRGKTPSDPRSKPVPGAEIPGRPAGQRPETAPPPPEPSNISNAAFGQMGRFGPAEPPAFSNFGMLTSFGGLLSPVFNVQFHGFPNASGYGGSSSGFHHYGYPGSFRDHEGGLDRRETTGDVQPNDEKLKKILSLILLFLLFALLTV